VGCAAADNKLKQRFMSELLLQTLVEKVTAMDKRSQETQEMIRQLPDYSQPIEQVKDQVGVLQEMVLAVPGAIPIPAKEIKELAKHLQQHTEQLQLPLKQEVRHEHHLHWPVITCFILGGVILMLVVFLNLAWDKIHEHRAADIKYRDLKLRGNDALQRILDELDSTYLADPERMEKLVSQEEELRQAERETRERIEEKKKEIREIEEKEKAHGGPKNTHN
jgi:hypothetical protein